MVPALLRCCTAVQDVCHISLPSAASSDRKADYFSGSKNSAAVCVLVSVKTFV